MESDVPSPPESNPPEELVAGANEALARIGENVLLGELEALTLGVNVEEVQSFNPTPINTSPDALYDA